MNDVIHIEPNHELEKFLAESNLDFKYDNRDKIEGLDNFILQLKRQNLYTKELEEFIENYTRFDNE